MLRRVVLVPAASAEGLCSNTVRTLTTRGQFNPIHPFPMQPPTAASTPKEPAFPVAPEMEARDLKQFKVMVSNPGPLRITYSQDYLDWYFRAYRDKVSYQQSKAQSKGQPALASGRLVYKGAGSALRTLGERIQTDGYTAIEQGSVEHGLYDCFERQGQFPSIHIDRCEDDHIRSILQTIFFDEAIDGDAVWEKALMYRALLLAKRRNYPTQFDYIAPYVDSVHVLANPPAEGAPVPEGAAEQDAATSASYELYPTKNHAAYFEWLVRKYHVDNAIDVHVVLTCHGLPDVGHLLFSNPPPEEDSPDFVVPRRPTQYPKLEALLDDKNLALARCLIFGEFNTVVSVDPFLKYPEAARVVSRPRFDVGSLMKGVDGAGAAVKIAALRGNSFIPMQQVMEQSIDARSRDVSRLQNSNAQADSYFTKELNALTEENPASFQQDSPFFNPRTVRAELRDMVSRKVLRGIRRYQVGRKLATHAPMADIEAKLERKLVPQASEVPLPTVPHYLRLLSNDRHVSFAVCNAPTPEGANEVRKAVSQAAAQMYRLALVYTKRYERTVERQKVILALNTLDRVVETTLRTISDDAERNGADHFVKAVERLGAPAKWEKRPLDMYGFPTDARMDDYNRWMVKPTGLKPQKDSS